MIYVIWFQDLILQIFQILCTIAQKRKREFIIGGIVINSNFTYFYDMGSEDSLMNGIFIFTD